ncbi:hypothetical protein WA556_002210, partial [Blastocystis sp. ATCC 50177/Nand II]
MLPWKWRECCSLSFCAVVYLVMQQTAIENFIAKIDELSSHIAKNKELLQQRRVECEEMIELKNKEKKRLDSKVLEMSRKRFHNTKVNYEGLQYAHDEHEIQEECSRLKDILDAKKSLYQRLKRRCTEMERVMQSEKEKRDVRIEQSVRDEATRASDELKGMQSAIQSKSRDLQEKEEQISSCQEDLDMLLLEKVENQEEYSRCTEEWKAKQHRVMELNQQQIALNQEYNRLRQLFVKNQKERSERRDLAMRKQVESIEKKGFRTAASLMKESAQWS